MKIHNPIEHMRHIMGYSLRIFFIDKDDNIRKIPLTRFDRIRARDPKEKFTEYKNTRIRYAEVVVELENRKPVSIARAVYGYLLIDSNGLVDQEFLDREMQAALGMLPVLSLHHDSEKVINSEEKFAEKRFKNEFVWIPSNKLEKEIFDKVFE